MNSGLNYYEKCMSLFPCCLNWVSHKLSRGQRFAPQHYIGSGLEGIVPGPSVSEFVRARFYLKDPPFRFPTGKILTPVHQKKQERIKDEKVQVKANTGEKRG